MKISHRFFLSCTCLFAIFAPIPICHAADTGSKALDPNLKTAGPKSAAGNPGIKETKGSSAKASGSVVNSSKPVVKKLTPTNIKAVTLPPKTIWHYYDIIGTSSRELKDQMKQKGPKGYWAYARWYVSWTANCEISLEINYTMPRWKNKNNGSKQLQKKWESMITNLAKHEKGHGKHGINAAKAIAKSSCIDANEIIQKWAAQDKVFDEETAHGRKQGVVLP